MPFSNQQSAFSIWKLFIGLLLAVVLTGCVNQQPIDTGSPINFKHPSGVFEMQAPKSWKQAHDQVETEALASFSDPSGRSEIIGYAGLLDHTLTDDEGLSAVSGLVKNLLNAPQDLSVIDKQRRSDGAFFLTLSFTRNNEKRSGQAIFRDGGLALSGVIVSGPQSEWGTLLDALQPYIDSFALKSDFVQGTYFTPIEDTHYALVVPADAARQQVEEGQQARSRSGNFIVTASQVEMPGPVEAGLLGEAIARRARQILSGAQLVSSAPLPDGRTKVILDQGDKRIIGYAEHKDNMLLTLFFTVPGAQAAAYQPMIDFIYSTWVTGKP